MCFHEKAVRSRWCLSPVLKCSVGTLRALCTIACDALAKPAGACCFLEGTLEFASASGTCQKKKHKKYYLIQLEIGIGFEYTLNRCVLVIYNEKIIRVFGTFHPHIKTKGDNIMNKKILFITQSSNDCSRLHVLTYFISAFNLASGQSR